MGEKMFVLVGLFAVLAAGVSLPANISLVGTLDLSPYQHVPGTLEVRDNANGVRGVYTTRSLREGEEIFKVPIEGHVLTLPDLLRECPHIVKAYSEVMKEDEYEEHLVGYCVAWLVAHGSSHPALALLPRTCVDGSD